MALFDEKLSSPMWLDGELGVFRSEHKFYDNVHGTIYLSQLERDVIDTPEFQRLGNVAQLGVIPTLFRTATHTRAAHSVGTCHTARHLVRTLNDNILRLAEGDHNHSDITRISFFSETLISLGALLHDVTHGPFSHDIETKSHRVPAPGEKEPVKIRSYYGTYPKHDDYERNAALYVALLDPSRSHLAKLLRKYSPSFRGLLERSEREERDCEPPLKELLQRLETWPSHEEDLLAQLLFHLLIHEGPTSGPSMEISTSLENPTETTRWGLGPTTAHVEIHQAWYQPYRHDIIGNTVSADLLDYLVRDMAALGIDRKVDFSFLSHYALSEDDRDGLTYCALDLNDYKRGTLRGNTFDDVMRLLDLRYEIHQKAVMHRAVQSGTAMVSRAAYFQHNDHKGLASLYRFGDEESVTRTSDMGFLGRLSSKETESKSPDCATIARKLAARRLFRPLMVVPGDRVAEALDLTGEDVPDTETHIRLLSAALDSRFFAPFLQILSWGTDQYLAHAFPTRQDFLTYLEDLAQMKETEILNRIRDRRSPRVVVWSLPYKQLYKDPVLRFLLTCENRTWTLEQVVHPNEQGEEEPPLFFRERARAAISDAETKYMALWKLFVFISDGLFYSGALAKLLPEHDCASDEAEHVKHLELVQVLWVAALRSVWRHIGDRGIKSDPVRLENRCEGIKELLGSFVMLSRNLVRERYSASGVSSVAVEDYAHTSSLGGDISQNRCRDSHYRFAEVVDTRDDENWRRFTTEEAVIQQCKDIVVTRCGREELPEYDLKDIVDRLGDTATGKTRECELVTAEPGREGVSIDTAQLCALWRGDPYETTKDAD